MSKGKKQQQWLIGLGLSTRGDGGALSQGGGGGRLGWAHWAGGVVADAAM